MISFAGQQLICPEVNQKSFLGFLFFVGLFSLCSCSLPDLKGILVTLLPRPAVSVPPPLMAWKNQSIPPEVFCCFCLLSC